MQFRVRKQDIKVRFEVIKPGTFSDTSLGVVEVATGALIPGIASDVWLQLGTTGIQLHVAILFVPDAQFQRDLIIQKATQRTQSGDLGTVISTGGSAILADVNRSIDPIGAPQPQVILVQQPPPTQPQLYTTAPIATQPPVMYVSQPSATQLQLHPQQQPPPQYPQGLYPAPQPYLQQPSQPMYAMPQQQQQQQAGAYVAPANLQQ